MVNKGIIYKATNMVNGKVYIGKTIQGINVRKGAHKNASFNKNYTDYDVYFHRAIRKHTFNAFKWEILEADIPENELNELEIEYISLFNTYEGEGYNMTAGGDGGRTGKNHHSYNHTIYTFYHWDGTVEVCTQHELMVKYDLSMSQLWRLVRGYNKSCYGWVLDKSYLKPTYTFYSKDGDVISNVSTKQFLKISGVKNNCTSDLISKNRKTSYGWTLDGNYYK